MYTAGLINREVHRSSKFDDIIGEFKAGIDLITTHSELKDHCGKFLKACIEQGGAIAIAARTHQNDWREVGMEDVWIRRIKNNTLKNLLVITS